ncbi:MAG TPA: DUF4259 domain-containing protein, partial [Pirellulales bacterium]
MGAWSHEPFGNDVANDWADGLEEVNDFSHIEDAFDRVLTAEDYLDADEAQEAIAAAETLAKMLGKGTQTDAYTETVNDWAAAHPLKPTPALLSKARNSLARILADDSELRDLWSESDSFEPWKSVLLTLHKS